MRWVTCSLNLPGFPRLLRGDSLSDGSHFQSVGTAVGEQVSRTGRWIVSCRSLAVSRSQAGRAVEAGASLLEHRSNEELRGLGERAPAGARTGQIERHSPPERGALGPCLPRQEAQLATTEQSAPRHLLPRCPKCCRAIRRPWWMAAVKYLDRAWLGTQKHWIGSAPSMPECCMRPRASRP